MPVGREVSDVFPPLLFLHAIVLSLSVYFLWNLERRGLWLWLAAWGIHSATLVLFSRWGPEHLLVPILMGMGIAKDFRRFR